METIKSFRFSDEWRDEYFLLNRVEPLSDKWREECRELLDRVLDHITKVDATDDPTEKRDLAFRTLCLVETLASITTGLARQLITEHYIGEVPIKDQSPTDFRLTCDAFLQQEIIALPRELAERLRISLLALNEGEVQPDLKPAKSTKKQAYTISRLKLIAFIHVHFLVGQGFEKQEAVRRVMVSFGHPHNDGREPFYSWRSRLIEMGTDKKHLEDLRMAAEAIGHTKKPGIIIKGTFPHLLLAFGPVLAITLEEYPLDRCGKLYQRAKKGEHVDLPPGMF